MQLRLIVRWSVQRPEFAMDQGLLYYKGVAAQERREGFRSFFCPAPPQSGWQDRVSLLENAVAER
jgi:hypothetical protein